MNTIIASVKRLRLARIVLAFLAGFFLLFNTACSRPPSADLSKTTDPNYQTNSVYDQKDNVVLKEVKESYKTVAPEGGMNQHRDVDRRRDTAASDIKAQRLVNRTEGNVDNKDVWNPKQAVENLQDNLSADKVKNKLGDVSDNVAETSHDIKKGAERGFENLKTNLKGAIPDQETVR
ncbi:DUF6658 family protein [Gloeocapsa sp. PCC 73106]|uniref:DUF6658 family protein n=1 Tax=Gloeocapsa sp. PCC 73106 TaxID=102232 RepID=UPI0002AD0063|nr:DUF6658 family protein [Gloeocapsa sp. PCC 73106]ELR98240.1 hypothetical protein GLO73106DRAFT_00020670 [Gloeocapsa sp. PCC 73106]